MFVIYETATGRLKGASALPIVNIDPAVYSLKEVEGPHRAWNTATLQFDPYPTRIKITPHDLLSRMTDNELGALITLSKTAVAVEVFLRRMDVHGDRVLSEDTRQRARTLLVNRGILTESRAAEVMDV
jgi:hypothetical protein